MSTILLPAEKSFLSGGRREFGVDAFFLTQQPQPFCTATMYLSFGKNSEQEISQNKQNIENMIY
jgi:hypothetical protein